MRSRTLVYCINNMCFQMYVTLALFVRPNLLNPRSEGGQNIQHPFQPD